MNLIGHPGSGGFWSLTSRSNCGEALHGLDTCSYSILVSYLSPVTYFLTQTYILKNKKALAGGNEE